MVSKVEVHQLATKIKVTLHISADTLFDEFVRSLARSKNPSLCRLAEALFKADERAADVKHGPKKGEAKVK